MTSRSPRSIDANERSGREPKIKTPRSAMCLTQYKSPRTGPFILDLSITRTHFPAKWVQLQNRDGAYGIDHTILYVSICRVSAVSTHLGYHASPTQALITHQPRP
jgi:hypothetical protein